MLDNKVQVPAIQYENVKYKQGKAVDALALAKRWTTSPDRANNIAQKTTQCGIRTVMNPHMSRRYPTNYRILRYPRLSHPVFNDTMIYGTVSKRVNNNSHVYGPYLNERVCFRLNRIVTLMRHYHYSSSVMVSYLKLS